MDLLELTWWLSWTVLMIYCLFVFRIRKKTNLASRNYNQPGVTVLIAVKNDADKLISNLPFITAQNYPTFEVIIVDDHSDEIEKEELSKGISNFSNIRLIHSERTTGKKSALSLGVENARYPYILCTDADCQPSSNLWIQSMIDQSTTNGMTLGYSPYYSVKGLLNLFVRFETVMTGMQYLSWAMMGRPYMGVGRNLFFAKDLFQRINPYNQHMDIPYGDDDLFVQQASAITTISVSVDPDSFLYTEAPTTFPGWLKQKHRHLSAGHHYNWNSWWKPGLYGIALILHWILLIVLFITGCSFWILGFMVAGLLFRAFTYRAWANTLLEKGTVPWYPVMELFYAVYLGCMGVFTAIFKKKAWN